MTWCEVNELEIEEAPPISAPRSRKPGRGAAFMADARKPAWERDPATPPRDHYLDLEILGATAELIHGRARRPPLVILNAVPAQGTRHE